MEHELVNMESREQIALCFDVFKELRPHLDKDTFIEQVVRQQKQSYSIVGVMVDGRVVSAAGFRYTECLAWGKALYVDDLSTLPSSRGHGHAAMLIDWLIDQAKINGCNGLHLDTGHQRYSAHKLYLKKGLNIVAHHLSLDLT